MFPATIVRVLRPHFPGERPPRMRMMAWSFDKQGGPEVLAPAIRKVAAERGFDLAFDPVGHANVAPRFEGAATEAHRLYQGSAILRLRESFGEGMFESDGFESEVEILHLAAKLRFRISEVPMSLDGSRRLGARKMKVITTSMAYLRRVRRYWS